MPIAKNMYLYENYPLQGNGLGGTYGDGSEPRTGKSVAKDTPERKNLMRIYNQMREKVKNNAINHMQSTSLSDLENAMRKLGLQPGEVGTISDYHRRLQIQGQGSGSFAKYGIYNTMDGPPGQHWFCCYGTYKYDPLGDDSSDTQEQPTGDDDCGQRCLAYLLLCKAKGGAIKNF